MNPLIGSALIGLGGSVLSGFASARGASSANDANREMSLQQMAFQERMARHAHRYEVADLRKAGLNPILSGTGGAGSATPSGSTAKMENVAGAGVSSALDALTTITQALLTQKQAEKTTAETDLTNARTVSEREQPGLIRGQTELTRANTDLSREQATTAKRTQENIAADTRLKEIGSQVSLSELDKNHALTRLFTKQGLTQDQQTRLMGLNADQAVEVLKGLRIDGAINESGYGEFLRYIDRTLETINKVPNPHSLRRLPRIGR